MLSAPGRTSGAVRVVAAANVTTADSAFGNNDGRAANQSGTSDSFAALQVKIEQGCGTATLPLAADREFMVFWSTRRMQNQWAQEDGDMQGRCAYEREDEGCRRSGGMGAGSDTAPHSPQRKKPLRKERDGRSNGATGERNTKGSGKGVNKGGSIPGLVAVGQHLLRARQTPRNRTEEPGCRRWRGWHGKKMK